MQATPPTSRISECPICPQWAVRCAHIDGQHLLFEDDLAPGGCTTTGLEGIVPRYWVGTWTGLLEVCPCGCGADDIVDDLDWIYEGDSYAEALAAFHEAEERLLRDGD